MRTVETEFFGDENKVALSKKISALWRIVEHDHRYESHGRGIGIHYGDDTDVTHLADLAHLLGHAACAGVPNSKVNGYLAELGELGLKGALFELWQSSPESLDAAQSVVAECPLPDDLDVLIVDETTPSPFLHELAAMTETCGISLRMGGFVRGTTKPSVFVVAKDGQGRPVGLAASVAAHAPEGRQGTSAFWGMLATDPSRRREKIGLILGAMAMIEMNKKHGYERFITGIESGYQASQRLCRQLGLTCTDLSVVIAIAN